MHKIIEYFEKMGGFARMAELRAASFQTRDIAALVQQGRIEKVKAGLYKLPVIRTGGNVSDSLLEVSHAVPNGVIALASALAHYDLTTFVPPEIHMAILISDKPPKIEYPPIRFFYFSKEQFITGIDEITTKAGSVRIYNPEKSICDMFRFRQKLGENLALEALKNYLHSRNANIRRLTEYSEICRVNNIMLPYMKAIAL